MRVDIIAPDGETILHTYGAPYAGLYHQPKRILKRSGKRLTYDEAVEIRTWWKAYRKRFTSRREFCLMVTRVFGEKRQQKINPWQVELALKGRTFGAYSKSSYEMFVRFMRDERPHTYPEIMRELDCHNRAVVANWVLRARREGHVVERWPVLRRGTKGPLFEYTWKG